MSQATELVNAVCPTTRKYGFPSRKAAHRFMKSRQGLGTLRAHSEYRCRFCGFWHITSQERRKPRRSVEV